MFAGIASQRTNPRLNVLRGHDPLSPLKLSRVAPPNASAAILSGMIVSLWYNSATARYEFVKGVTSGVPTPEVFIAYRDQTDDDVAASGLLVALSCADDYEVQTPFYNTGGTYTLGTPLTIDGTTGNVKPAGSGNTPWIDGTLGESVIIGYVSGTTDGPTVVTAYNSSAVAPVSVLQFTTRFQPFHALTA